MIKRIIDFEKGIKEAEENLKKLKENDYPGRVIILGIIPNNLLIQIYCVMGRSPNSRNRIFEITDDNELRTAPADSSKIENSELLIYNATAQFGCYYIVSNGKQTDAIRMGLMNGINFSQTLESWEYEPDAPHYTPRICGIFTLNDKTIRGALIILKRSLQGNCDRYQYGIEELREGYGCVISTYDGNGDPLPSFSKEVPDFIPLKGNEDTILDFAKNIFNRKNVISIGIKFIDRVNEGISWTKVWNKYKKKEK